MLDKAMQNIFRIDNKSEQVDILSLKMIITIILNWKIRCNKNGLFNLDLDINTSVLI